MVDDVIFLGAAVLVDRIDEANGGKQPSLGHQAPELGDGADLGCGPGGGQGKSAGRVLEQQHLAVALDDRADRHRRVRRDGRRPAFQTQREITAPGITQTVVHTASKALT